MFERRMRIPLNPRINDLFTLTKLFQVFKIFDSVDEAVASFSS